MSYDIKVKHWPKNAQFSERDFGKPQKSENLCRILMRGQ